MSEESMNSEERVKLIKWGCKYAENYKITATYPIGKVRVVNPSNEWLLIQDFPIHYLYRDFLQQVIEGINRDGTYRINQYGNTIAVCRFDQLISTCFDFKDYPSITQAKEAAIFYIMDQEGLE